MVDPSLFSRFSTPGSTIDALWHSYDNQETYHEHIDTLRLLLVFIKAKAVDCDHAGGLWEIKPKKAKKLIKLLESLDELFLEIKEDNG